MKRKVDKNQREIVEALRAMGAKVQDLHTLGKGVPDLLVSKYGQLLLVEVKGDEGELTNRQKEWMEEWNGVPVYVVRNVGEARELVGVLDGVNVPYELE